MLQGRERVKLRTVSPSRNQASADNQAMKLARSVGIDSTTDDVPWTAEEALSFQAGMDNAEIENTDDKPKRSPDLDSEPEEGEPGPIPDHSWNPNRITLAKKKKSKNADTDSFIASSSSESVYNKDDVEVEEEEAQESFSRKKSQAKKRCDANQAGEKSTHPVSTVSPAPA